jgi:integrase
LTKRTKVTVRVRSGTQWIRIPPKEKKKAWPPFQPTGTLLYDFTWHEERYREPTRLRDNEDNRLRCLSTALIIENEIALGTFEYVKHFPNGLKRARYATMPSGEMTLKTFGINIWQPYMRNVVREERTKKEYMDILHKHVWTYTAEEHKRQAEEGVYLIDLGTIALRNLRPEYFDQYIGILRQRQTKRGRRLNPKRVNKILDRVRQILLLACKRKYLADNPEDWITRQPEPKTDVDPLSREEVKQLLVALPQPTFGLYAGYSPFWPNFYTVAVFTGMRPSEQFALTWESVDFTRKQILIRQGFVDGEFTALKTTGSHRVIDMLPRVETALRDHHTYMGDRSPYVFPNATGGLLDVANLRNYIWLPTLKRAGLRLRKPYQTRHTFASNAIEAGESLEWVKNMLGHTTLKTLFDHYARFIPNRTRQDGSALAEWLNG